MKKFDIITIGSALRDIYITNQDMRFPSNRIKDPFNPEILGGKISLKKMYFDVGGGGSNTAATFANMG